MAETVWQDAPLHLAKLVSFMNVSGPPMARLLRLLDATPGQLVVVYDDLDLPFGTVRTRQRGRHGGHHGMESILTTLGIQEVRRVKIGVGRPATRDQVVDWVLTSFSPEPSRSSSTTTRLSLVARSTRAVRPVIPLPPQGQNGTRPSHPASRL